MKVDLCMWAKNGERFLPYVLRTIDQVIPEESICRRIFVDDHSIDDSRNIAKDFNWEVFINPKSGIGSGANEALKHVKQNYIVTVEQDVLLNKQWWDKITPQILSGARILTVEGLRIATNKTVRIMEQLECADKYHLLKNFRGTISVDPRLEALVSFSLDNNIWNVKNLKSLGGFPNYPISTDRRLKALALKNGYEWKVDPNVVSLHLRGGIIDYNRHHRTRCRLEECTPNDYLLNYTFSELIWLFLVSPFGGIRLVLKTKHPNMLFAHPLQRLGAIDQFALRRRVCSQRM